MVDNIKDGTKRSLVNLVGVDAGGRGGLAPLSNLSRQLLEISNALSHLKALGFNDFSAQLAGVTTQAGLQDIVGVKAHTHSAADLTSGTVPAARISGDYTMNSLTLNNFATSSGVNPYIRYGHVFGRDVAAIGDTLASAQGYVGVYSSGTVALERRTVKGGPATSAIQLVGENVNGLRFSIPGVGDYTVWNTGNDGSGSGMDADFLDGQHGTYYRDLANSTGVLPNARISGAYDGITSLSMSGLLRNVTNGEALRIEATNDTSDPYITFFKAAGRQGYIQHADGTGAEVGMVMHNDLSNTRIVLRNYGGVDGLGYRVGSSNYTVYHSGNVLDIGTSAATARNALQLGGLAMSEISALVYSGSDAYNVNFPIGTVLLVSGQTVVGQARNTTRTVRLLGSTAYQDGGSGDALTGTWRKRSSFGFSSAESGSIYMTLLERTA